jgi:hypothetical protein
MKSHSHIHRAGHGLIFLCLFAAIFAVELVGRAVAASAYVCYNLGHAAGFLAPLQLGSVTVIADLWTPAIWIPGMAQRVAERASFLNTPAVVRSPLLVEIATGGGIEGNAPFLRDPNHNDEPQVEGTAPTLNNIPSGNQKCPILNRVSATGTEALAAAVSGADPLRQILATSAGLRDRQRNRCVLNILRGVFGFSTAPAATTAALYQNRLDAFSETGASPTSDKLIDNAKLIAAVHQLGEEVETFNATGGAIVMHSTIAAALQVQDQITYVRNSEGTIVYAVWKGVKVFMSDLLSRAGTTSGTVYDTYILGPGSIGMGDKPQSAQVGDAASLLLDTTQIAINRVSLYDRTRFVAHVMGTKWKGTPAGQSATNAELATVGNWELAYSSAKLAGAVCLRTNG